MAVKPGICDSPYLAEGFEELFAEIFAQGFFDPSVKPEPSTEPVHGKEEQ